MAKYKKTFNIFLPTCLFNQINSVIDSNPPEFHYEIEGFYGMLRDIITSLKKYDDSNNMIPLSSSILQKKYGENYRKMLDYLCYNYIIIHDHRYSKGKCMTYNLYKPISKIETLNMTEIPISLNTLYGNYIKRIHNKEQKLAKGKSLYLRKLRNKFYSMKIDTKEAIKELDRNKSSLSSEQYIAIYDDINSFNNKNLMYFKRGGNNNRVNTNLTSLKSYFKKFIISDIPLYQLDLKNSQPVLFNIILDTIYDTIKDNITNGGITEGCTKEEGIIKDGDKRGSRENPTLFYTNNYIKDVTSLIYQWIQEDSKWVDILKKEIPLYKKYTSNGTWYNHLADIYNKHYNTEIFSRDMSKSLWMALAYSGNYSKKYNRSKLAFEKEYKGIGRILKKFKQKEYNQLAICLQQIESKIFIDTISKKLCEKGIEPYTIHDSIIVTDNELEETREVMIDVLNQYLGFSPILEVESLSELEFKEKFEAEDVAKIIDEFELSIKNHKEIKLVNEKTQQECKLDSLSLLKKGDYVNIRSIMCDIYSRLGRPIDSATIINFELFVNNADATIGVVYKAMLDIFKENRYPISDYKHILIDEAMIRLVQSAVAA